VLLIILFGATQSNKVIGSLADVSMGLIAMVNLIAILLLSNEELN